MDYRVGLPTSIRGAAAPTSAERRQPQAEGAESHRLQVNVAEDQSGIESSGIESSGNFETTLKEALSLHLYGPRDQSHVVPRAVGSTLDLRG